MSQDFAINQPAGFKNHIENVAIVGAGGQVGKFIVDALLKKGTFNITAITREDSTNTPPKGVRVARINYDDKKTIVEALKGQDALIITMAVRAPPDQSQKLIEAAAEAGVPWVLPNEFGNDGANEEVGRDVIVGPAKQKNRELIQALGKSRWIGIVCGFWYEYSLSGPGLYGIDIAKKEVTWFDEGTQRLHTSTWPQTGRAVAEVLSLPIYPKDQNDKSTTLSSYANKFVYIASFTLNQREMFESVKRVTKTTDSDWKIDSVPVKQRFEDSKKELFGGKQSAFPYLLYSRYFFPDDAGVWRGVELDNEKLGLPKEDLDTFTKEAVKLADEGYYKKIYPSS